jgi:hypothetical protein
MSTYTTPMAAKPSFASALMPDEGRGGIVVSSLSVADITTAEGKILHFLTQQSGAKVEAVPCG